MAGRRHHAPRRGGVPAVTRTKVANAIERVEGFANEWELNPQNTGNVYSLIRTRDGKRVELTLAVDDLRILALAARSAPDEPTPEDVAVDNAARPWDATDDAGFEHLDRDDDE